MQHSSPAIRLDYRRRICLAMDYISAHLGEDLSLEEIAQAAHFSPFHFHRIFGAMTGETVFAFLRRLRLEAAAGRLRSAPVGGITEIALDLGFSSSQAFAKAFRAHFGCTPSAFRQRKDGHILRKAGDAGSLRMCEGTSVMEMTPSEPTKGKKTMSEFKVKTLPMWHVAYARKIGPYGPKTCGAAFAEIGAWARVRGLMGKGPMLGIYWDDPQVTEASRCRVDACVAIPPGTVVEAPLGEQDIPGGPYLVGEFNVPPQGISEAWNETYRELATRGLECANSPCYEMYYDDCSGSTFRFDICIPLKA